MQQESPGGDPVVAIYPVALPQVYGYLLPRCGSVAVAEDLTAETFTAAVAAVRQGRVGDMTLAWLIAVARHKLVDRWRRVARERRGLTAVEHEHEGAAPRRTRRPAAPGRRESASARADRSP